MMAKHENSIDFSKICRLCLTEESVMSSIYNETDKHSSTVPLPLKIMACVSIELNSIDGLPSQICTTCLCQVDGWYKFKNLCETADAVLKKCIKNEPVQHETISEIRSRAKEVRQFFASSHFVKVESLNSALEESPKNSSEMTSKNEEIYLMKPESYVRWLLSKFKLNDKITLKEMPKTCKSLLPDYEITFDSHMEILEKGTRNERLIMQMGNCELLEVNPTNVNSEIGDHGYYLMPEKQTCNYENPNVETDVAGYERTKKYLEKAFKERGNTQDEVIEKVQYTFRLDEDGQLDVVNITEGVSESPSQRGFRYTCLFCSKIVLNKLVYDKHVRESHLDFIMCKICNKQLYSLRNYLIHMKTHLGVYTYRCPLCGKGLTRASIFKSHMQYHYYGKVQKCEICEKKFRDIFALRRHVSLHDKKIKYICELCGFGTHLKSNLMYHVRTHSNEKSFMCELCGKQFSAQQGLQHHMKTHKPNFPCSHCKRVFRHENKFHNHFQKNHLEVLSEENDINDFEKNVENRNEDGFKLYSLIKIESGKSSESTREKEGSEDDNFDSSRGENGQPSDDDDDDDDDDSPLDGETLTNRIKSESESENSSDDDMALSARKRKMLREKNKRSKTKKKVKKMNEVRHLRTVQLQTGDDEEDYLEIVEMRTEEVTEKKKSKSRKTQTVREQGGTKKRFRIRPAVPSSCTLCDKVYKNGEILRQHMKSHHVTGTIECPSCKLTFTSLRSLKYHEQRKHSNLEPVPCTFCGKKFLDKKYLRIHENIHSQANHFVCQFCGRKFIMKTNLTVHISRHHTKKSNDFICQICGKAFPFKLYLKKHFKTHTDDKPYQCTYCEAKFRENTLLRKHVNSIHLKLRPFLCQYCQKSFTRSLYLKDHMESQHLGIQRKVECSKCGETFLNRNRLRQHECLGRMEIIRIE